MTASTPRAPAYRVVAAGRVVWTGGSKRDARTALLTTRGGSIERRRGGRWVPTI